VADPFLPIMKTVSVTSAGQTVDLGAICGQVDMRNIGPNTAFFATGSTPPTASVGAARYGILMNEPLPTILNAQIQFLSFKCAAGETATVEIVAIPSSKSKANTYPVPGGGGAASSLISSGATPGQLIKWTTPSWSGTLDNAETSPVKTTACNVDITGCKSLVAQVSTITAHSNGYLTMEVQFDGGGWTTLVTAFERYATNAVYAPISGAVDCTGKLTITGLRLSIINNGADGETLGFGGDIVWLNASPVAVASAVAA
jgi:hypothetical protein